MEVKVPKKPTTKSRTGLVPPQPQDVSPSANLVTAPSSDEEETNIGFKVSRAFKKTYKSEAALRGITQKELLRLSFEEYMRRNPRTDAA